ncbi:MAG: hypothetical protein M3X11_12495 [Acidobacteriota bacterium]|nr:hypothetical protein [Acidobacteriota bacterium]
MNLEEFEISLADGHPPASLSPYLTALWHDRQGDWGKAHEIVQDINTDIAARIHAYLHRKEGDESNAGYWYRTAKRSFPAGQTPDEEWEALVKELP